MRHRHGQHLPGFADNATRTRHVVYHGNDEHIHHLAFKDGGWKHTDLTASTGATTPLDRCTGRVLLREDGTLHVIFTAFDWHVYDLWIPNWG